MQAEALSVRAAPPRAPAAAGRPARRVLHVLDHSLPTQTGYSFRSLSIFRAQRSLGCETFHLTSQKQGEAAAPAELVDGWEFFRTAMGDRSLPPLARELALMRATARRLEELVRELRPDLIHAHSPLLNGYPALWVGRRHKIPVLYEVRAFWEDAAVDHGTAREGGGRYRLTRALETRLLRKVDLVTAICEGLRTDIIGRGIDPAKVLVAPNVVDEPELAAAAADGAARRAALGLADRTILGFIGSFYAYEGLELLVEALGRLRASRPELHLLLVGGGREAERLRARVAELGLEAAVTFTGRVPHGEVNGYYGCADIMVYPRLPMRLTDLVTPLKPLEAMLARRIVVASDVGGHRELVTDGETGFLFRAGDVGALAGALERALAARAGWEVMIARAAAYVQAQRSLATLAASYRQAFERIDRQLATAGSVAGLAAPPAAERG